MEKRFVGSLVFVFLLCFSLVLFFNYMQPTGSAVVVETPDLTDICSGVQDLIDDIKSGETLGMMKTKDVEICYEDGKPIVYFFGSDSCPHCVWEHPVVTRVAEKFGDSISFHDNKNTQDDMDVFFQYSTGGIPTVVYGCRYYQLGAGSKFGEQMEEDFLTAYLCVLTGN